MSKINIVGFGPGSIDYLTPAGLNIIKESDLLIGTKRLLDKLLFLNKEKIEITNNLSDIVKQIKDNYENKRITILCTGDSTFYSILNYLKNFFKNHELNIIPGISSVQYMFAKIGLLSNDAKLVSMHGRDLQLYDIIKENKTVAILTDTKNTPQIIADCLIKAEITGKIMYVGNNLSYKDEEIIVDSPEKIREIKKDLKLSVVIIDDK
jgi:cobalt-precorrin-7 (C5)-methyltransferase